MIPIVYRGKLRGLTAWLVALSGAYGETPLAEFRRKHAALIRL